MFEEYSKSSNLKKYEMNSASEYHWRNIQRYIYQIPQNPFLRELKEDLWNELHDQQRRWIYMQLTKLQLPEYITKFFDKLSSASLEWISEHITCETDMTNLHRKIQDLKTLHPNQTYDDIIDGMDEYTDLDTNSNTNPNGSNSSQSLNDTSTQVNHTIDSRSIKSDNSELYDYDSDGDTHSNNRNDDDRDIDDLQSTYSRMSLRSTTSTASSGLIPRMMENEFTPTPLKMVTSTAVCSLQKDDGTSFEVDFKQFYNDYNAPPVTYYNILTKEYADEWIGKVVGCKTGSFEPKGRYHPHNVAQFFNSVTLIVSIEKKKEVNVKLFKNGKLQLTGIPSIEAGNRAVWIVLRYIEDTYNIKLRIEQYLGKYDIRTVMLNTCYEVGFPIHREVLYEILVKQYNLIAMYDTEGYPGVRLQYYYNPKTVGTVNEGICRCSPMCKGSGDNEDGCKRISVAIFQSGKIIIAGGCHEMKPIEHAYTFLNQLLRDTHHNIRKYVTTEARPDVKKKRTVTSRTNDIITQVLHKQLCQGVVSASSSSATSDAPQVVVVPTQKLKWTKIEKSKILNINVYKTMVMYCTVQLNNTTSPKR
jgi:TATA-box binding protein (TBP) (component of TFIID and TFIIIB)